MKTKIVQILFIFLCTVLAAAIQDMLPSFGGAKPPILLALSLYWAITETSAPLRDRTTGRTHAFAVRWAAAAFLAGVLEDALSEFPLGCATGFFLLAGAGARLFRTWMGAPSLMALGLVVLMSVAPFHELWLSVWGVAGTEPSAIVRFFASALPAAPTGALVFLLLPSCEQLVGFHGPRAEGRSA